MAAAEAGGSRSSAAILCIRVASSLGERPRSAASVPTACSARPLAPSPPASLRPTCSESFMGLADPQTLDSQLLPAHLADAISFPEVSAGIVLETLSVCSLE